MTAEDLVDYVNRGHDRGPDRIALCAGGESWTYAAVREAAARIPQALGDQVPARIGLLAGSAVTSHVGVLGILSAGAAVVPLNPTFPSQRTAAMLRAANVATVVADERSAGLVDRISEHLPGLRCVLVDRDGTGIPESRTAAPERPAQASDAEAYVMFTSGSTGRPKGVPISHGNVLHFLAAAQSRHRVSADDVLVQTFEPTFDLFMFGLFLAWGAGARLVALPTAALHRLPEFLRANEVSVWFSVPSTIRLLRRRGTLTPGSMPSLRRSLFCGEPLTYEDAGAWCRAAPRSVVDNLYGPTELTISCTAQEWSPSDDAPRTDNGVVPIGQLHEGLSALLLDEDRQRGPDEGELCINGPQMFRGYLDPADDQGRFVVRDGAQWYRTGDRVRREPDGGFAYLGRVDHQVKIRGYRVELLEVEHEIGKLDAVTDCGVVAVDDEAGAYLFAAYAGVPEQRRSLIRDLSQRLPGYMIPAVVQHVTELPLSENGKIDRNALLALALRTRKSGNP
jgi:amino acid adenylation domain-containing protein